LHDVIAPTVAHALGGMARDDTRQVLEQAPRFSRRSGHPWTARGRRRLPLRQRRVRTPSGYLAGYAALCEAGWNRVSVPEESGGAGLPELIDQAVHEFSASACNSLASMRR